MAELDEAMATPGRSLPGVHEGARGRDHLEDHLGDLQRALEGLRQQPGSLPLQLAAADSLLELGATRAAAGLLESQGLRDHHDAEVCAVEARLARDRALALPAEPAEARWQACLQAADRYVALHMRAHQAGAASQAAALLMLAGEPTRAEGLARWVLEGSAGALSPASVGPGGAAPSLAAAVAAIVVGDVGRVAAEVREVSRRRAGNPSALAAARRQLRLLCAGPGREGTPGLDETLLEPLRPPAVATYTGHMIAPTGGQGRFASTAEPQVAARVRETLERRGVGQACGSLACGGDILVAEALLERGGELHVVLPFAVEEFVATSVARGGPAWVGRFERCLAEAHSVTYVTRGAYGGDDRLFDRAARRAMGLALLRARLLGTEVFQLAIWDGLAPVGLAGTAVDVARWTARGLPLELIEPGPAPAAPGQQTVGPEAETSGAASPPEGEAATPGSDQETALVGGELVGTGQASLAAREAAVGKIQAAIEASVAPDHQALLSARVTAEGLHLVVRGPALAARIALGIRDALEAQGLAARLAVRLAPEGPGDPALAAPFALVTPAHEIYLSEAVAAEASLHDEGLAFDEVGLAPAGLDEARRRLYRLR